MGVSHEWEGVMVMRMMVFGAALALLMSGCQAGPAVAEAGTPSAQGTRYYDGQRWRKLWVNEQELVEFVAPGREVTTRALDPAGTLLEERNGVRIWRLGKGESATRLSRSAPPPQRLSPVFRLSPNGGVRLALSGNILVRFKPEWSDARIQEWIAAQRLTLVTVLKGRSKTHLLTVGGGAEALERANAIHESGEVSSASPEWWREVTLR